jgi:hypothetical protein
MVDDAELAGAVVGAGVVVVVVVVPVEPLTDESASGSSLPHAANPRTAMAIRVSKAILITVDSLINLPVSELW